MITYVPTGKEYLPYEYWGKFENAYGYDFVSFGPNQTGVPLASGELFTGFWGGYYQNNEIKIRKLANQELPSKNFTGVKLNWFGNAIVSSDKNRFCNFSMCFDNSGIPVIAFQDNGDPNVGFLGKPEVRVFSLISGSVYQTGWKGECPTLVNFANLNNYNYVTGKNLEFKTGQFTCFYKKGDLLAKRYGLSKWANEMIVTGASFSGYDFITRSSYWVSDYQSSERPPSQLLMLSSSSDGQKIKVTLTKKYFNFISENFDIYNTGQNSVFNSGIGKIKESYYLKRTPAYIKNNTFYFDESFDYYSTGVLTGQISLVSGYTSGNLVGTFSKTASFNYGSFFSGGVTVSNQDIGYVVKVYTGEVQITGTDFDPIDFNYLDFY